MDLPPEAVLGIVAVAGLYQLIVPSRKEEGPIIKIIDGMRDGRCPQCEAYHPEALSYTGPARFWTHFRCPECGYTISAHVHQPRDED